MLRAYFDASKTEVQSGVYLLGGYVGTEAAWTDFEADWNANLAYWGISDFHLTDCLAHRKLFDPAKFKHDSQLCALSFSAIIRKAKPEAIWSGVVVEDWAALDASPAFRTRYPSPYQFMFHDVLWQLSRWGMRHAKGEMIAPVFDVDTDPRSVQPICDELRQNRFYENLVVPVTFGSRKSYVPIQAADILAGEAQLHWLDREYPREGSSPFASFRNIFVNALEGPGQGGLWTPDTLKRAVAAFDEAGDPFNWPVG